MSAVLALIKPRYWSFQKAARDGYGGYRNLIFALLGLAFWLGIFAVSYRVLLYFQSVEGFGEILAHKLLSMVLLTFVSMLTFSAILTSLSKLYLSRDLALVHSLPVPAEKIFLARWIEAAADSAWMVIIYTLPVLLAYGIIFHAGIFFYANILITMLPLCVAAAAVSALLIMLVVIVLPASRIRSIFIFLGLAALIVLYITFRLVRPERLVDPEAFTTVLIYLRDMSTPASPLLPTTWALDSLKAGLSGRPADAWLNLALLYSSAAFLLFVDLVTARAVYFKGYSKAQAAMLRLFQKESHALERLLWFLTPPVRAFVVKEFKSFWRDQTQWSQLFLVAALIAIYLYNFSVLPLEKAPIKTVYLQNLFSFLNMGLAAFVLTSITARFAFPSVSMEGSAFWIVRAAPISIATFLWIKFAIYVLPLVVFGQILIVWTNVLLHVTPFMMVLSSVTMLLMTPGVIALGIGLGAAYPDFGSENPVQAVTGFGGLIFMVVSAAFIGLVAILEAGPVYTIFMAGIRGQVLTPLQWVWTVISFAVVVVLCAVALVWPMRFGAKRLGGNP